MLDDFILEQQCDEFDNDWFDDEALEREMFAHWLDDFVEGDIRDDYEEEDDWLDVLPF